MQSDRLIFLSSLNFATTRDSLQAALPELGDRAYLIIDPETEKSRGLAIAALPGESADSILGAVDGREVDGRKIAAGYAARSMVFFTWFSRSPDECPASLRPIADSVAERMRAAMSEAREDEDA